MTTPLSDGKAPVLEVTQHNLTMTNTDDGPTDEEIKLGKSFKLSRNPSEYEASAHLLQRIRERPNLEADVVAEIIEKGEVANVRPDDGEDDLSVTLRGEWLFTTFEVVVAPNEKVVKTAYSVS